jgi:hypothetical protein
MSTNLPTYSLLKASREDYDAAHRLSDIMRGIAHDYTVEEIFSGYIAVRLSDGNWDGNLYDSHKAAVSHQSDPKLWAFVSTRHAATGMSPQDAHAFLTFNRLAYANGFRLTDPDAVNGGKEFITPAPREDLRSQISRLVRASGARYSHRSR